MEVEILVAEVGARRRADDQLFHILYDGTVIDEDRFSVLGGDAEAIADAARGGLPAGLDLAGGPCGPPWPALAGPDRTLAPASSRCAVAARGNGRRAFRRIDDDELPLPCSAIPAEPAPAVAWLRPRRRRSPVRLLAMERRIFGLENEYGVTCTLRGQRRLSPDEVARYLFRRVVSWGRSSNVFLAERRPALPRRRLATPSTPRPSATRSTTSSSTTRRGSGSSRAARQSAEQRLREEGIRGDIYLFKNNTDSAGNSYGCHENYLTSRARRLRPLRRGADPVPRQPPDLRRRRQGAADRPRRDVLHRASGPSTSGRACRRRPPAAARSSTPATSPTPTPSATAASTSSSATRT